MKKTESMSRLTGSTAGFTLIELMIVVAIIGILVAVAIPNFLKAMDKARYTRCVQALSGLKVAEEMYISDNNTYIALADVEKLGMYMIPGCTVAAGCGTDVTDRIKGTATKQGNCKDFNITTANGGFTYQITGTANDRTACKICMNAKGYNPEKYKDCAGGAACTFP